jgi:hypothetical protein
MGARETLSRWRRSVTLTIGCAFAVPAPAGAAPDTPAFVIALSGCDEIDRAALLSLLELEVSEVEGEFRRAEPASVELACVGEQLHIQVHEPATGKRLGRTVPRPTAEHGERSVALAISQLFLTSRLAVQLPSRAVRPGSAPGGPAVFLYAGPALAPNEPAPQEPNPFRRFGLGLRAGVGVRDLAAPVLTQTLALNGQVALDRVWALTVVAGVEHGIANRERGSVELWLGDAGLGADLTLFREGVVTVGLGAFAGVVWSRLAGQPAHDDVRGSSAESVGARIALLPRASLELDWLVLSIAVEAGVDLGLPVGLVSEERAVTAGGFFGRGWLGIGVRFGD